MLYIRNKMFFVLLAITGLAPSIAFTLWGLSGEGLSHILFGVPISAGVFVICFSLATYMNGRKGNYWMTKSKEGSGLLFLLLITFMLLIAGGFLVFMTIASFLHGLINSGLIAQNFGGWILFVGAVVFWYSRRNDWEIQK